MFSTSLASFHLLMTRREALHPFNVFKENGFEVDLVSETGTYQADWLSQQPDWLKDDDKKVWEDTKSEFRQKLDSGLKPYDLNPDNASLPVNSTNR